MDVLTIVSALVGALGLFLWGRKEAAIDYAAPPELVGTDVYRRLEHAWKMLFRRSPAVRFTIFAPDRKQPNELRPIARIGWGRASAHSLARFRKGEGIAGVVWGGPPVAVARLGPFESETDARRAQEKVLHLSPEKAAKLSSDQLRAQVIVAARLDCGNWPKGVLCIDCVDPALVPEKDEGLLLEVVRLAASLAPLIPGVQDEHIDLRDVRRAAGAELKEGTVERAGV